MDDDPDLLKALRLRLRANNCDVITVSDGYSVVGAAQKERPDVIILDLGLPAGDRFVVLAAGYLLKLSFDRGWISPAFRCAGGAIVGGVVGALGWRLYHRPHRQPVS